MSKIIDSFINKYSLSKTLRFKLIPIGKTEENFYKHYFDADEKRAENYVKVKNYMDNYHKYYIESVLKNFVLTDLQEYAELYFKSGKTDAEQNEMDKLEEKMRKEISSALKKDDRYSKLSKKEFIKELLPAYLEDEEEKAVTKEFNEFSTYFTGFFQNRANMYSDQPQTTAISYRCINENLPKFLDNVKSFVKIKEYIPADALENLERDFSGLYGTGVCDVFNVDYFSLVLAQSGIDKYNQIIGGYTNSDGTKVQGLNEYINLYNQQVTKKDKSKRLPFVKPLYKQILSDRDTVSFLPEDFADDDTLLKAVNTFYCGGNGTAGFEKTLSAFDALFDSFENCDLNSIYVKAGLPLTDVSNSVFGSWDAVEKGWNAEYESTHVCKKGKEEKFFEKEKEEFKRLKSLSVSEVQRYGGDSGNVAEFFRQKVKEQTNTVRNMFENSRSIFNTPYTAEIKLASNEAYVEKIKDFLDSVKDLEKCVKPLLGTGKEAEKDNLFYSEFERVFEETAVVDKLYDRVRNYLTKKPYSEEKIKLNFENPQFLGGWDKNKERDYRSVILRKKGIYYLAVMNKSNSKIFLQAPEADGDCYEKMEYKLLPDPSKMLPKVFFAASNEALFSPPEDILKIREQGTFKKGESFSIADCRRFIDFYKESIAKHEDWSKFGFRFSPTQSYEDISKFFREVAEQGYSVKFVDVSAEYIDKCVEDGSLYLFKIYNKDFSEYSHGTPNMHTLYFKMLFDERNLADVVYKLNGESEMFFRKASIKENEKIVHPANKPIANKNPNNPKKSSEFAFDMVKDRRYTVNQFSLHIPLTMNFKAEGEEYINNSVRAGLKEAESVNVIGIDRGERNLIYVTVVNGSGDILEQKSLNVIDTDRNYSVDYHDLLDRRESERDAARKDWKTIGTIKELKEGYLSQAVHEICKLVVKYDAVIAMEDLNSGFINSRKKVDKQVYQKFEKMLTEKLNYLVDKKAEATENGGLLKAYQLTNKADKSRKGLQDGIIFYIPAWLTSKIDPDTGFVNLFNADSEPSAEAFVSKLESIRYNEADDLFEISFDYSKFPRTNADYRKKWTVCTYGERIRTYRNPAKNNQFDFERVALTEAFKKLFTEYGIDISGDIKAQLLDMADNKKPLKEFIKLFMLTVQLRNSVTGTAEDYLISPVRNKDGRFFDSRTADASRPCDADANGAYNIARKALWAVTAIKTAEDYAGAKISIPNAAWLEYAQKDR